MTAPAALPVVNQATLARYLMSVAATIRRQLAVDEADRSADRLAEAATVAARVAQHLAAAPAACAADELAAVEAANAAIDAPPGDAATAGGRVVDADRIEAYLRAHPRGGERVRVVAARLLSGGRCKTTARIEQTGARDLPQTLILRQDWDGGATDTNVADEGALLALLARHGVKAPVPLLVEPDAAALDGAFILVEEAAGAVVGGLYDPPRSPSLMRELAAELGRLHAIPLSDAAPLFAGRPPAAAEPAAVAGFAEQHGRIGIGSAIIDRALDWLARNADAAGDARCLIHNDLGFHNILVAGGRLSAVLDWELAAIGHPASDLGYIRHFVEPVLPWDEFLALYRSAGGAAVDPATLRYHALWNAVRLYGLIMQARWNLEIGRVDDMEIVVACADSVMRLLQFVGREIADDDHRSRETSAR